MSLTLLKAPVCEPVGLDEVRHYLRIDHDEDNDLLKSLVKTARQAVEAFTARALIQQSWRFRVSLIHCQSLINHGPYLSHYKSPTRQGLELPRSPFVQLIDKPKVVDQYSAREFSNFRLDTAGRLARLHFSDLSSPDYSYQGEVQIDFIAGYGSHPDDVPEPLRHALLIMVADLYEQRSGANDNSHCPPCLNAQSVALAKPYKVIRLG